MRRSLILVALVLGCGSNQPAGSDGSPGDDAASDASGDAPTDAPGDGSVPSTTGVCSSASWCWQNPSPHGNTIRAIAAVGGNPNDVWAVGGQLGVGEIALHWDGTRWSHIPTPPHAAPGTGIGSQLSGVWAASSTDVWAVGTPALILHWTGAQWTKVAPPLNVALLAVWGANANDIWAVGNGGIALHYTNGSWTSVPTGVTATLHAVHGTAANDVWITGSSGTILHWNGATFDRPASVVAHTLGGVWAASATDAWITSSGGQLQRWNGTAWSLVTAPGTGDLRGITGRAADDIWAVGYLGRMLHWNGTAWSAATGPNAANALEAVAATTGGFLAMGFHGAAWRMTTGQVEPTSETVISAGAISDLYVVSETEAFAVSGGILLRLDGTGWKPSLLAKTISGISGTSASDVWGVGINGSILHFDGATWSEVASPTTKHLVAVLALATDDAWAVGSQVILHWNGTSWSTVTSPVVAGFVDLWAASPTDIWAVGTGGAIVRWNGIEWTQVPSNLAVSFQTVWGSGANDVWIMGNSQALKWNGSTLTPGHPAPIAANQLWGTSASNIFAATSFGSGVAHYNGSTWTDQPTANTQQLFAIGGAGNRVWGLGAGGAILMR